MTVCTALITNRLAKAICRQGDSEMAFVSVQNFMAMHWVTCKVHTCIYIFLCTLKSVTDQSNHRDIMCRVNLSPYNQEGSN